MTGCRPKEASWIAVHGEPEKNVVDYPGHDFPYKIVMPVKKVKTKTGVDYTWLIERRFDYFI